MIVRSNNLEEQTQCNKDHNKTDQQYKEQRELWKVFSLIIHNRKMSISLNCCEGLSIGKIFFRCCKKEPEEDKQSPEHSKPKSEPSPSPSPPAGRKKSVELQKKDKTNKMIVFHPLPPKLNLETIFDKSNSSTSITLIFSTDNHLISAHSEKQSLLFGTKTLDKFIGMNISEFDKLIPKSVIKILSDILERVKSKQKQAGCLIEMFDTSYICCGFPIMTYQSEQKREHKEDEKTIMATPMSVLSHLHDDKKKEDMTGKVVSVIIIKQPFDPSYLDTSNLFDE